MKERKKEENKNKKTKTKSERILRGALDYGSHYMILKHNYWTLSPGVGWGGGGGGRGGGGRKKERINPWSSEGDGIINPRLMMISNLPKGYLSD